jgi:CopG family transcriptional regulator/antitoxin EndoAI
MARDPRTVTVSLPPALLREIDRLAESEGRTRSELFREALRQYMHRIERWDQIFAFGEQVAKERDVTEEDVARAVKARRRSHRRSMR